MIMHGTVDTEKPVPMRPPNAAMLCHLRAVVIGFVASQTNLLRAFRA